MENVTHSTAAFDLPPLSELGGGFMKPMTTGFEEFWRTYVESDAYFTDFQLIAFGTLLLNSLLVIVGATPSFLFLFMPFMHKYKIQPVYGPIHLKDRYYTTDMFWKCYKVVLYNHIFGMVGKTS